MNKQTNTTVNHAGRRLWVSPWSYNESFIISGALILLGFVVEIVFRDQLVPIPGRPKNFIILFLGIMLLILLHTLYRKAPVVKWLSSIPCSISAIVSYAALVLLLGFVRQEGEDQAPWLQHLGLNHMKNSWPFLLVEVYLFISLGMVILRRSYPLTGKNLGFLLNHFGLWLTLIAVAMGSGDLQRLRVSLFEKTDFLNKGISSSHEIYSLPFSLKLLDFKMETYNPKIMLSDSLGNLPEKQKGETLPVIEKGAEYKMNKFSIKVLDLLPAATRTSNGYIPSDNPFAAPAALVHVEDMETGDSVTNWLCCGSSMMLREYILLEKNLGLWMMSPEPKQYESDVVIKTNLGDIDTVTIGVNRPYKIRGWSLYQFSYEEEMGPASQLSIIEAVYDPWLRVVYAGIILMIAGAMYLFWLGRGVGTGSDLSTGKREPQ
jgi:hypothetical protein